MYDQPIPRTRKNFIFRFHLDNGSMVESNEWVLVNMATDLPYPEVYPIVAERLALYSSPSWDVVHVEIEKTKFKSGIDVLHIYRPKKPERSEIRMGVLARSTTPKDWMIDKYKGILRRSHSYLTQRRGDAKLDLVEKTELGEFTILEKALQYHNDKIFHVDAPSEGSSSFIVTQDVKDHLKPERTLNYITKLLAEARACSKFNEPDGHVWKYLDRLTEEALYLVKMADFERGQGQERRNSKAHPVLCYETALYLIRQCKKWSLDLRSGLEDFVNSDPRLPPQDAQGKQIFPSEDEYRLRNLIEEVENLGALLQDYANIQADLKWE